MRALFLAAVLATTPALAAEVPPQDMMDWQDAPQAYTFGDWTVTAGATGPEDARIATLKVERPGFESLERQF